MSKTTRISRLANKNAPTLNYFILQAQGRSLYLQFLRTIQVLPEIERKSMFRNIKQEFTKSKLRVIYLQSSVPVPSENKQTDTSLSSSNQQIHSKNLNQSISEQHENNENNQNNNLQDFYTNYTDFGPFTDFTREIDYHATEALMKERIEKGKRELKHLKEMIAMTVTAQSHLSHQDDDEVPIEDVATQWDYPEDSPYENFTNKYQSP